MTKLGDQAEALHSSGNPEGAMDLCRKGLAANPADTHLWLVFADILGRLGKPEGAVDALKQAAAVEASNPEIRLRLGQALFRMQRFAEAEMQLIVAGAADPNNVAISLAIGVTQMAQQRIEAALASFRQALRLAPENTEAMSHLGVLLEAQGQNAEAEGLLSRAISGGASSAEPLMALGRIRIAQFRHIEALACFDQALALVPGNVTALNLKAICHHVIGENAAARAALASIVERFPGQYQSIESNYVYMHDYDFGIDEFERQRVRRDWAARLHRSGIVPMAAGDHDRRPDRKLRIGYVSADFRMHSAFFIFGPVLLNFDRGSFDIVLFSNAPEHGGAEALASTMGVLCHSIFGRPDAEVAELIRSSKIDILVDLSGHSGGNRLPVFAMKPAPVQVTAWGYLNGTGLAEIDYIFADKICLPEPERAAYAEKTWDLPCLVSYLPPRVCPDVTPLPAAERGHLTFGVFNRLQKIWNGIPLYAETLYALPKSHLVIKAIGLNDPLVRQRILDAFAASAIPPERLTLLADTQPYDHLAAMGGIDIALDAIVHSGGAATLECLWMGVPILNLPGWHLNGRMTASMLDCIGLKGFTAASRSHFVELAQHWSGRIAELAEIRAGLRQRLAASAICDGRAYAGAVEAAYRSMWQSWCRSGETRA